MNRKRSGGRREVVEPGTPESRVAHIVPLSDEVATEAGGRQSVGESLRSLLTYVLLGTYFGVVLMKSEVVSWFRIQEMFRFQAFHMYGVIGSAVVVAAVGIRLIKWKVRHSLTREPIEIPRKEWGYGVRYAAGGVIFGCGWALTGACPGPLFALLGGGVTVIAVTIVSAILGTWTYGLLRPHLIH